MFSVLDLFSNIGGHALGLSVAGPFDTVQFVEIQPQRRAFLASKFSGVPIHDDIKTFKGIRGSAKICVGGPPCKNTSKAAAVWKQRTGETLWPWMLKVCLDVLPEWIIVEQPPGNVAWEKEVARDLARHGWHNARLEFAASDLGAPHIRRRVFLLAHPNRTRLEIAWASVPLEIAKIKGAALAGNDWGAPPPRTLRVVDGISAWLDRNAAVEALGDSNPPIMMTVIGRAILHASPRPNP